MPTAYTEIEKPEGINWNGDGLWTDDYFPWLASIYPWLVGSGYRPSVPSYDSVGQPTDPTYGDIAKPDTISYTNISNPSTPTYSEIIKP